jgi:hypothetical protein
MTSISDVSTTLIAAIKQAQAMVLALNNHGVMLLSHHECAKAHACFLDAVHILQKISLTLHASD